MRVNPGEYLEKGTKVTVGYKYGEIVESIESKDQFNQFIYKYKIQYTKKFCYKVAGYGGTYKPYNKVEIVNYAGINVI